MKIRINNIEARKYNSTKSEQSFYEIVKWEVNKLFGKEDEYREDGYVDSFGGDFLEKNGHRISKSSFQSNESCFVVAFLRLNKSESDVDLESVGSRILDLSDSELSDFMDVYRLASEKIKIKYFK